MQHPELLEIIRLINFSSTSHQTVAERKVEYAANAVITTLMQQPYVTGMSGKITQLDPLTKDYSYNAVIDPLNVAYNGSIKPMKVVGILKPKSSTMFGSLSRGVYYTKAFRDTCMNDAAVSPIYNEFKGHIENMRYVESTFNAYVEYEYDDYTGDKLDGSDFFPKISEGYANCLNGDFSTNLSSIFASFLNNGSDNLKTDKVHMRALAGLKVNDIVDENDSTKIIGHDIQKLPMEIDIYPKDFSAKDNVTAYIKKWNSNKTLIINGEPVTKDMRSDITYTDTISLIVEVISTLVTTVSISLIAFTSLSLVVSCFMIAVITYISVMERIKEIGVIRSLGGRKRDVSTLFISENLITGFASGTIGIIVTYILQAIINAIVAPFGVSNICALPFYYALMMIGIAIALSVISGLIPSLGASKKDPVIALRTE